MSFGSRFVTFNSYKTHYTESGGDGPVIVALHGGGAGSSGEAGMASLMKHVPPEYRVIAPDSVGGFGQTDVDAPAPYGLLSRADHLAGFVDALGLKKFILLGNSQGAWVAARYALTHPDRVEGLVLIGSATLGMAMGLPDEPTPAMQALFGYDGTREGMRKLLKTLVYNKDRVTDELVDLRYRSSSRPGAMEAFNRAAQGTRFLQNDPVLKTQFSMEDTLPILTRHIQTLVAWGEDDDFAPASIGRKLEPLLPSAAFHYIKNAGHQVQNDQPEQMAQLITQFMQQLAKNAKEQQ